MSIMCNLKVKVLQKVKFRHHLKDRDIMSQMIQRASGAMAAVKSAVGSAFGRAWNGRIRGDTGKAEELLRRGAEDVSKIYSKVEMTKANQFPPALVQRGELYSRTDAMIANQEVFRYQLGNKQPSGFQPVQLETWWMVPNWLRRIYVVADLFAVKLVIGGVTFCTNVLVRREGIEAKTFPGALETGDGYAYAIDKTSWLTYLKYKDMQVSGIPMDVRLLYLMLVNRDVLGQISLHEFAMLPLETINGFMISTTPGVPWEKPLPREASLRDLKIVDEESIVIVSESDSANSSQATSGSLSQVPVPGGSGDNLTRNDSAWSDTGYTNTSAETSLRESESSSNFLSSILSGAGDLGGSPNLSTDVSSNHVLDWSNGEPPRTSSAKKALYPGDLLSSSDGLSVSTRMKGRMFLNQVFPVASQKFIDERVNFIMMEGRDLLMEDLATLVWWRKEDQLASLGRVADFADFNKSANDWNEDGSEKDSMRTRLEEMLLESNNGLEQSHTISMEVDVREGGEAGGEKEVLVEIEKKRGGLSGRKRTRSQSNFFDASLVKVKREKLQKMQKRRSRRLRREDRSAAATREAGSLEERVGLQLRGDQTESMEARRDEPVNEGASAEAGDEISQSDESAEEVFDTLFLAKANDGRPIVDVSTSSSVDSPRTDPRASPLRPGGSPRDSSPTSLSSSVVDFPEYYEPGDEEDLQEV